MSDEPLADPEATTFKVYRPDGSDTIITAEKFEIHSGSLVFYVRRSSGEIQAFRAFSPAQWVTVGQAPVKA